MTERIIEKIKETNMQLENLDSTLSYCDSNINEISDVLASIDDHIEVIENMLYKHSIVNEIREYAKHYDIDEGEVTVHIYYARPNMTTLIEIECLGDEVDTVGQHIGIWQNRLRENEVTPVHILNNNYIWKIELTKE